MKTIASKDNPTIRRCLALHSKKYRDRYGEFLVEGTKLVEEALHLKRVRRLLVREDRAQAFAGRLADTIVMPAKLFEKIADTETAQGVAAIVAKGDGPLMPQDQESCLLVLDRLQDPGNIGTIIRTAEAAGYGGVVAIKGTADVYAPKVVRAGAGAILRIPVLYVEDEEEAAQYLAAMGKTIVCTALDAEAAFYEVDLHRGIALVIGNEGHGVSKKMQALSDKRIMIPMQGETESLNAAVAAGILMYQKVIG